MFPFQQQNTILIPPSPTATKLSDYVRAMIYFHLLIGLLTVFSGRLFPGAFDLLACFIGLSSIKQIHAFSFQQIICYTIYCSIATFFSLFRLLISQSNFNNEIIPGIKWQFYIYQINLLCAPIIQVNKNKNIKNTIIKFNIEGYVWICFHLCCWMKYFFSGTICLLCI
jgi:hypothetical protein